MWEEGIIVDQVSEVLDIAAEDIEDAPSFGAQVDTDYIRGMGKAADRVTILLDIIKLLSKADVSTMGAAVDYANKAATQENPQAEQEDAGQ